MTNKTNSMTCTCCGAFITAPQFHNGKAYGWSCIKKVNPAAKQSKVKFVAVEVVKNNGVNYYGGLDLVIKYDNKVKAVRLTKNMAVEQNGVMWIREDEV